jgi:hypothetical protein
VNGVFVDFGHGRVYALPEDGEEVMVFGGFLEMLGKLRPKMWLLIVIRGGSYQP